MTHREIAGGDPQAVMAAVAEYYKLREEEQDEAPTTFECWDFTQTLKYTARTITGPGSEIVLQVFDEEGEMVGWAETGFIAE